MSTEVLADGIHFLTRIEYDEIERVNFSLLKFMGQSPAHYRYAVDARRSMLRLRRFGTPASDDTKARLRGRAVSLAVFEPHRFEACAIWTGGNRAGKSWTAFQLEHASAPEILNEAERDEARKIAEAVRRYGNATRYLTDGRGEVAVLWTHRVEAIGGLPGYAIQCKGLLDYLSPAAIVDLKNAKSAEPVDFGRSSGNYLSHVQASFYRDGVHAVTGQWRACKLIAIEPAAPFVAQLYNVPERALELGRSEYATWLDRLNRCQVSGQWPGYADHELDLELPRWLLPSDDDFE